ncbi:MAG: hypothetical protein JST85_07280 [Acidobacteria bacterium]|nr:hypothetical protein [Acidobacteriota bacterium]
MPDQKNLTITSRENAPRPLLLIEVLVGEYEQQRLTNPTLHALEPPYNNQGIKLECDKIAAKARVLLKDAEDDSKDLFKESSEERCEFIEKENDKLVKGFYQQLNKHQVQRAALCFSGGGIRSATFALGLMQGLVKCGVKLGQFHYLSTVSGGGYIGSWLSAWIHRQGVESVEQGLKCSSEDKLSPPDPVPTGPNRDSSEPEPIRHLRRFSNYMSPKLGLFSADTWTLVGIFLRNLLLNWTVLIPVLVVALGLPRLMVSFACWDAPANSLLVQAMLVLAFLTGVFGVGYMVVNLPSWRKQSRYPAVLKTEGSFLLRCWVMLNLSAIAAALYWSWTHIPNRRSLSPPWSFGAQWLRTHLLTPLAENFHWLGGVSVWRTGLFFILFGFLLSATGFLIWRLIYVQRYPRNPKIDLLDFTIRALAGALGGLLLYVVVMVFQTPITTFTPSPSSASSAPAIEPRNVRLNLPELPAKIEIAVSPEAAPAAKSASSDENTMREISQEAGLYVTLAPPLYLLMFLIAATIFIGLASTYTNDADREWMARSGGWMLITIFGWSALSALVIFGPVGLVWLWGRFKVSLLSISTLSGVLTLVGGFSAKTPAKGNDQAGKSAVGPLANVISTSLPLAATIFAVIILAALSLTTSHLIAVWLPTFGSPKGLLLNSQDAFWHLSVLQQSPPWLVVTVIGLIALFGLVMSLFVNINKFSLHAGYRDRLIRAYLGASQGAKRRPNPFTGFDDLDNLQMHDLLTDIFRPDDFASQLDLLIEELRRPQTAARKFVSDGLNPATRQLLACALTSIDKGNAKGEEKKQALRRALADEFNRMIEAEELWEHDEFSALKTEEIQQLITAQPWVPLVWPFKPRRVFVEKLRINRMLVEQAFAGLIAESAKSADKTETIAAVRDSRPLHIVNIALNLVGGKDLAWQERKAQPFTVSALHAGSHGLGYRPVKYYAISRQQDAALSLGTAMAISGAAVSPNMGYHSSSMVTFLLMLFNVRLGWWLGNPGQAGWKTFIKPSPFFTPKPLIAETLGMTDSTHAYVYLSDGDHFENLALYEMVRRRCHFIIVSDAGADGDYSFHDLGNALRKIRIDLGISIEFEDHEKMPIQPRKPADKLFPKDDEGVGKYFALAKIKYSEVDEVVDGKEAEDGWILYIKPTVYGIEPPDVQNYAKANPTFPHETTGDQMYSESQFESYRALGEWVIKTIVGENKIENLESLLQTLRIGPTPALK